MSALICPVCRAPLARDGASYLCAGARRHSFDVSRAGHLNLAGGGYLPQSGDPPEMVHARTAFLDTDHYRFLADAIAARASGTVADCGCGDGYYSTVVAKNAEALYGFDLSKAAVEKAAKRARAAECGNALFAVSSVYSLPLADESCDTVVSVFAPCAEAEYRRVLRRGGRLILAAAAENHLDELKAALYTEVHKNTARSDLPREMREIEHLTLTERHALGADALRALYLMTPYCRRTAKDAAERLFALPGLAVTFSFDLYVFER